MVKKVVVYEDEVSGEKFLKMKEVNEIGSGRVKLVDYKKLVDELDGKMMSVRGIGKMMKKCSGGKKTKVYYSEVLGMLKRLVDSDKIVISRRRGEVIYYKIKKVVK